MKKINDLRVGVVLPNKYIEFNDEYDNLDLALLESKERKVDIGLLPAG